MKKISLLVVCALVSVVAIAGGPKKPGAEPAKGTAPAYDKSGIIYDSKPIDAYAEAYTRSVQTEAKYRQDQVKYRADWERYERSRRDAETKARTALEERQAAQRELNAQKAELETEQGKLGGNIAGIEAMNLPADTKEKAVRDLRGKVETLSGKVAGLQTKVDRAAGKAAAEQVVLDKAVQEAADAKTELDKADAKLPDAVKKLVAEKGDKVTAAELAAAISDDERTEAARKAADAMYDDLQKTKFDADLLLTDFEVLQAKLKGDAVALQALKDRLENRLDKTLLGKYISDKIDEKMKAGVCTAIKSCGTSLGENPAASTGNGSKTGSPAVTDSVPLTGTPVTKEAI